MRLCGRFGPDINAADRADADRLFSRPLGNGIMQRVMPNGGVRRWDSISGDRGVMRDGQIIDFGRGTPSEGFIRMSYRMVFA
jgi:hypothetical protein